LRIPGPRQSILGLFGGPGFLLAFLALAAVAAGIAYLATIGYPNAGGGARMALPVPDVPATAAPPYQSADATKLKPMPAIPVAKEIAVRVPVEEDLAPAILLAKHPPAAEAALIAGSADLPAWQRFARPSLAPKEARRLAVVVTGLGVDRLAAVRLITGAPPEVTLSFNPDVPDLADWIVAARAFGHEALIDVAMGSQDHLAAGGLVREFGVDQNLRQLETLLDRAPAIAGVAVSGGGNFMGDAAATQPILSHLQQRGLAIVGLSITAPLTIAADTIIAPGTAPDAIDEALRDAATLAERGGKAVTLMSAPEATHLLGDWYRATQERGEISLVPVSALVED
jgi:uncharacterized protein